MARTAPFSHPFLLEGSRERRTPRSGGVGCSKKRQIETRREKKAPSSRFAGGGQAGQQRRRVQRRRVGEGNTSIRHARRVFWFKQCIVPASTQKSTQHVVGQRNIADNSPSTPAFSPKNLAPFHRTGYLLSLHLQRQASTKATSKLMGSGKEVWLLPVGGGSILRPTLTPVVGFKESRRSGGNMSKNNN
jgi:hypothetical protein